jgi:hypothetical protein
MLMMMCATAGRLRLEDHEKMHYNSSGKEGRGNRPEVQLWISFKLVQLILTVSSISASMAMPMPPSPLSLAAAWPFLDLIALLMLPSSSTGMKREQMRQT